MREVCIKDLTNQRFGKLIALYPLKERKRNQVVWHCKCDCGNEYDVCSGQLLSGQTHSCGCSKSKGETKIVQMLSSNNINFQTQKTFSNCLISNGNKYSRAKFDFCVNDQYLIEYDGQQHFKCTGQGWDTEEEFEKRKIRDAYKNQWCKDNHIPLIRIPYTHYDDLCIEDLMLETTKFRVEGT